MYAVHPSSFVCRMDSLYDVLQLIYCLSEGRQTTDRVCLSSVCLSVTLVRPTQAVEIFGIFLRHLVLWSSVDTHRIFHGDRPRRTPPPGVDWLIEYSLTSHLTQYRSYRDGFLRVKWPNRQCQSTEGSSSPENRLQSHQVHLATLQYYTCIQSYRIYIPILRRGT